MNDRDPELDEMLAPLRTSEPSDLQLRRWEGAVLRARAPRFGFLQLAAALLAGFILGATLTRGWSPWQQPLTEENSQPSATIVHLYANAE